MGACTLSSIEQSGSRDIFSLNHTRRTDDMEDTDIWRAAEQMRKLYGDDDAIHAAMRADKPLDQGDAPGCEASQWGYSDE
jgi:hypothetical protein